MPKPSTQSSRKTSHKATAAACPCDSNLRYADCCARWHRNPGSAPDAQALMRSRYSAYALQLIDYVRATWHPNYCPQTLERADKARRWLGLQVKHFRVIDSSHASVEFVARYKIAGQAQRIHEISEFVLENGRWLYTKAHTPPLP